MRFVWRWLKRGVFSVLLLVLLLLAPIGYVEIACRGDVVADEYQPVIAAAEWRRAESRTLLTYPEWHIVHAYDDYARIIRDGDPHDYAYIRAILGFWTSLCPLTERAAAMGGVTGDTKATIYTIGVSFTVEMLAKALYEESLGRVATWFRGATRTPLDDLSARQAKAYADFLQQTPWYKWDFASDAEALIEGAGPGVRDWERRMALGVEYKGKAAYADVIAQAVEGVGADELRLRSLVTGTESVSLSDIHGVTVIEQIPEGIVIETDRYRAFTKVAEQLAATGVDFVEIAGNDEILFTSISDNSETSGAIFSFQRQGYGDYRHLILVPVSELADRLRNLDGLVMEHVHDY
ncbi:MAG: hypothetical protein ACR2OY_12120 [Boseongicola sp.]